MWGLAAPCSDAGQRPRPGRPHRFATHPLPLCQVGDSLPWCAPAWCLATPSGWESSAGPGASSREPWPQLPKQGVGLQKGVSGLISTRVKMVWMPLLAVGSVTGRPLQSPRRVAASSGHLRLLAGGMSGAWAVQRPLEAGLWREVEMPEQTSQGGPRGRRLRFPRGCPGQ